MVMFGLPSMQKILVLVAILAFVWYGFKFLGRLKATRAAEARERDLKTPDRKATPAEAALEVEETVLCATCGAYVPARGSSDCGKAGCPY